MLVLTRKRNESIIIDGRIEVMVSQIRGDRVRLSFRAAEDVKILRAELCEKGERVERAGD